MVRSSEYWTRLEKEFESKKAFNDKVYEKMVCEGGFEEHRCNMRKNHKDGKLYCPLCRIGKSILIK